MGRIKKVFNIIWKAICNGCVYIIKRYVFILNIGYMLMCVGAILDNKLNNIEKSITVVFGYLILLFAIYVFNKSFEEENEIPKMEKRFTHKNEFGAWYVKGSEWQEAVLYLSMLEDYIHGN